MLQRRGRTDMRLRSADATSNIDMRLRRADATSHYGPAVRANR
ncbi:hypothetical protein ACFWBB_19115 [Streptomyces sp. NPDC060000]